MLWLAALLETRQELRRQAARRSAEGDHQPSPDPVAEPPAAGGESPHRQLDELFIQAQRDYLAGDWVAAEQTLRKLRRVDRDDIEGQLLLASVWTQTNRRVRARRLLNRLARRQDAEAWRFEIDAELLRLSDVVRPADQIDESPENGHDKPNRDESNQTAEEVVLEVTVIQPAAPHEAPPPRKAA